MKYINNINNNEVNYQDSSEDLLLDLNFGSAIPRSRLQDCPILGVDVKSRDSGRPKRCHAELRTAARRKCRHLGPHVRKRIF